MAQGRTARTADEEPAELRPIGFDTLAAPPGEDSGYLPSRDDQSWRELEALGFAATHDEDAAEITAEQDGELQEDDPESDSTSDSIGRGEESVMLLMVAVAALVTVALAFPGMLTADFWRAHRAASPAKPASAPARVANVPAPPMERLTPPQTAPANGPGFNNEPAANAMPEARPDTRAAEPDERGGPKTMVIGRDGTVNYVDAPSGSKAGLAPAARGDRGTGGVYAMAPGPDGVLRYQYFPSRPEPGARPAARAPSRDDGEDNDDEDSGGVYAMAPGPDGKLEYQYFPPEPSR